MGFPDLRQVLLHRYPWLADVEHGPQTVEAGECDRCGLEARLVAPCGPPPSSRSGSESADRIGPDWALGRRCALELGVEGWCTGHEDEAHVALTWLSALPAEADDVARLWWVATGEARVGTDMADMADVARRLALPEPT
jgi:hypothetical protein